MSDTVQRHETAMGAPEAEPDPREVGFETGRPRLGGRSVPIAFTDAQVATLNAIADTMIPPGGGFPAPSDVDVVDFIGRYVTADDDDPIHFPEARESAFKAALDALGDLAAGDTAARTETLRRLESDDADFFEQLRSLVYYGYYSRPEVTIAIREQLPAGRDYHGPPQPYGYLKVIEGWDHEEETYAARGGGAGYIPTADVKRIDLSKIEWIKEGK